MSKQVVSQIERRALEGALLGEVYQVLLNKMGQADALSLIEAILRRVSSAAGKEFAATASPEPSLAHFATIMEVWQQGDAMDIKDVRLEDDKLSFQVTRCGYVDAYKSLGLPGELCSRISCLRDYGFVEGYSPRLRLERPATIGDGAETCNFTYTWEVK